MIGVLLIVSALIIIFFIVFQKRKNKLLFEKFRQQQEFEEELTKSQLEIQDQTLKNVGQELHDNVGQLLSFASMQLNLISTLVKDSVKEKVDDTKDVISNTIQEVRALSKSLNSDVIANFGLLESIQNEVDRMNKLNVIKAELSIVGKPVTLKNKKDEIILFRIVQEFFSNTIKYADAKHLKVLLKYSADELMISLSDDGMGFDESAIDLGSGLINMKSRAELINTHYKLESASNKGTDLELNYKLT
ncbi:MAG: histidine kinase [Bacteroidia bacterium]|nr:histidine kinase [Bacteroidia bacterium]MBT8278833.1 histidine kinase [Bacteroidia bacterium]NND26634.1 histidine kinase [Flavobacteriaceae bacterium]NNK60721.1 histidine kinase [Flavobacteriaceae bacterium]NNL34043.1 histidine kinase [Flavobacteriaceae bacterium]